MTAQTTSTFSERCRREATRDVVFVLQRRRFLCVGIPDGWDHDDEGDFVQSYEDDAVVPDEPERMTLKECFDRGGIFGDYSVPCVHEIWDAESVWLSREEATDFAERTHYNYPDGWRVYGIPSSGLLPEIIRRSEHYRRSYETVLVGQQPGTCPWFDESDRIENIIRPGQYGIKKNIPQAHEHPTEKPVELPRLFIELHTARGGFVLDPFMGSGSTAEAAKETGRRFLGIELEERWCERAANRLRQEVLQFQE